MLSDKLVQIAYFAGAFGIKGECKIFCDTLSAAELMQCKKIYSVDKKYILTPKKIRKTKKFFAVFFEELPSRNEVELLPKMPLFIERDSEVLVEKENIWLDYIDMQLYLTEGKKNIAQIVDVKNFGAGNLFEIQLYDKKDTIFVPFDEKIIDKIEKYNNIIYVNNSILEYF